MAKNGKPNKGWLARQLDYRVDRKLKAEPIRKQKAQERLQRNKVSLERFKVSQKPQIISAAGNALAKNMATIATPISTSVALARQNSLINADATTTPSSTNPGKQYSEEDDNLVNNTGGLYR